MTQNRNHNLGCKLKDYSVIQFDPNRILMQHRVTHRKFVYKELFLTDHCRKFLDGLGRRNESPQGLLKVEVYADAQMMDRVGLLLEYAVSDLERELANRLRMRKGVREVGFQEEELANTFGELLTTLKKLHSWGQVHGCLRGRHIVISEDYQIKLCDAFLLNHQPTQLSILQQSYYAPEFATERRLTVENDLWAVGMMILECACLESADQFYKREKYTIEFQLLDRKIKEIEKYYSDEFIIALKMLLSRNRELRSQAVPVFLQKKIPDIPEIQSLRPIRGRPQQVQVQLLQKVQMCTEKNYRNSANNALKDGKNIEIQPTLTLNLNKKQQKQNQSKSQRVKIDFLKEKFRSKLNEDSELKKKQIDKINQIIEKNSAFVNDLVSRKFEKKHSISNKPGIPTVTIKIDNNENSKLEKLKQQPSLLSRNKQYPVLLKQPHPKQSPTKIRIQVQKLRSLSRKK